MSTTYAQPTAQPIARPDHSAVPASTPHPNPPAVRRPTSPPVDNRPAYLAWGLAWLAGHGTFALASGDSPLVDMPGWLPGVVLGTGLVAALVVTAVVIARASKHQTAAEKTVGTMIGVAWGTGFTALALMIIGSANHLGDQHLHTIAWPTGSALVVGLLYVAGGAATRDVHRYTLGSYLALVGTGALLFGLSGMYVVLATAGAGGYLVAAALEPRRLAASSQRPA